MYKGTCISYRHAKEVCHFHGREELLHIVFITIGVVVYGFINQCQPVRKCAGVKL